MIPIDERKDGMKYRKQLKNKTETKRQNCTITIRTLGTSGEKSKENIEEKERKAVDKQRYESQEKIQEKETEPCHSKVHIPIAHEC